MTSKQANSSNPQFTKVKSIIAHQLDDIRKSNVDENLQDNAVFDNASKLSWWKRICKRISK